jgi:hypothetical protein
LPDDNLSGWLAADVRAKVVTIDPPRGHHR